MCKYNFRRQFLQTAVPLLLTVSIMLTGCGQTGNSNSPVRPILPDNSPDSSTVSSGEKLPDPVTIVVEDDSTPPAEGMVRSRLTNEWVDADVAATRPIAVMIPNEASAIPQYSLSDASIIYEANVENRMTRMMAIYEDWQNLDKIGNIRSLRDYYAYWAFEWDAFIVHFGGPFFINELLAQPDTQDVDGTSGSDEAAFFRTTDRNKPHNAYASGEGLQKVIEKKGYSLGYRGLSDENHFRFATKAEPNTLGQYGAKAKDATYIDMSGCYPLTRCYFEFNEDDGLYYRSQHLSGSTDGPHIDAATGEQLTFKNILVQNTFHEELGEGYLAFQCHDTTRDGWFFTNGRGIHVNWEKTSDYSATRYYDDNGDDHFVGPLFAIADFLLFDKGFKSKKIYAIYAVIPPLCYVGFVYLLALTGVRWYQTMTAPYNFLNYNAPTGWFGWDLSRMSTETLGIGVAYMIILLLLIFIGIGLLYLTINKQKKNSI